MAIKSIDLPVINFDKVVDETSIDRRQNEAEKLIDAFTNFGFAIVDNIDGYDEAELFKWLQWFYYEIPVEDRIDQLAIREFNSKNVNIYRGIFPLVPGKLSHKEGYDMGDDFRGETELEKEERLKNPLMGDTPRLTFQDPTKNAKAKEFYKVMYKHREILTRVADNLMSLIAEAGGESSDFFVDMFHPRPLHTLRTIMYPKRMDDIPKGAYLPDGRIISTPAHQDSGFLTLLQTFGFPGLEIQLQDDQWHSVQVAKFPQPGGTLVVNVGEQLSAMSNGRFRATIHRVLDIGTDRFSMPFFYEPSLDASVNRKIPQKLLPEVDADNNGEDHNMDDISYGSFLLSKLPIYAEWSRLLEMLPSEIHEKYLGRRKTRVSNWASRAGIEIDGMSYDDQLAATQST